MTIDDEIFFAWLDGELDGEEAARVESLVAADPALSQKAAQHRALAAGLQSAFGPVLSDPVDPAAFGLAPPPAAPVIDLADARRVLAERRAAPLWQQWGALAATLALGIVTGTMVAGGPSAPVAERGGQLVASADLDKALDVRLASAPEPDGARIGLTFRNGEGAICRTFASGSASGLACRDGDDWRIEGLVPAPSGQAGDYRMASGSDPALAALVDGAMAGEPMDAAQEQAARDAGWR